MKSRFRMFGDREAPARVAAIVTAETYGQCSV